MPAPLPLPVQRAAAAGLRRRAEDRRSALARGDRAWVGHHIGDLRNYETLRSFTAGVAHFERLFAVTPEIVAHDLHPEYLSTKYARERDGRRQPSASSTTTRTWRRAWPSTAIDRTGGGRDLRRHGLRVRRDGVGRRDPRRRPARIRPRAAHLRPVRLPGGEAAIREPWRMACAWLAEADGAAEPPPLPGVDPERWAQVAALARSGLASPLTSSAGRLCDAVAAMCGIRLAVTYEGQAAIELEAAADPRETGGLSPGGRSRRAADDPRHRR